MIHPDGFLRRQKVAWKIGTGWSGYPTFSADTIADVNSATGHHFPVQPGECLAASCQRFARRQALPAYCAWAPSSPSMRRSWLYLAVRSERAKDPVLICPQFVATARSAIVASSVSPERCDMTAVYPAL